MGEYPRPAACHPERCVETSPHNQIVQESVHDVLIVECDLCATVVSVHPPEERAAAEQAASNHITTHHPVPNSGHVRERQQP